MRNTSTLADRRGLWAFMLGVVAVTVGVLMHLPMFLMARHNHFNLSGMPIGWDMILGMIAIIGGGRDCRIRIAPSKHRQPAGGFARHCRDPARRRAV